jgi:hypothetical protein
MIFMRDSFLGMAFQDSKAHRITQPRIIRRAGDKVKMWELMDYKIVPDNESPGQVDAEVN